MLPVLPMAVLIVAVAVEVVVVVALLPTVIGLSIVVVGEGREVLRGAEGLCDDGVRVVGVAAGFLLLISDFDAPIVLNLFDRVRIRLHPLPWCELPCHFESEFGAEADFLL